MPKKFSPPWGVQVHQLHSHDPMTHTDFRFWPCTVNTCPCMTMAAMWWHLCRPWGHEQFTLCYKLVVSTNLWTTPQSQVTIKIWM